MGPLVKWVSNRFEQFPTNCSEIEPEIRFLIKDGNDIARLLEIHTLLKMEGNSALNEDHPQNSTWKVCVGIWKAMENLRRMLPLWIKAPESLVQLA